MKPYKFYITAFPIDRELEEKLSIYSSGIVSIARAGSVIRALFVAGYKNMRGSLDERDTFHQITIHFTK